MKRISRGVRKTIEREFKPVLDAKDAEIAKLKAAAKRFDERLADAHRERDDTARKVLQFFEKQNAVRMDVRTPTHVDDRFRLVLDIDERMVRQYLEWGNDFHIIDMLGQQLGREATRRLAGLNLMRRGYGT